MMPQWLRRGSPPEWAGRPAARAANRAPPMRPIAPTRARRRLADDCPGRPAPRATRASDTRAGRARRGASSGKSWARWAAPGAGAATARSWGGRTSSPRVTDQVELFGQLADQGPGRRLTRLDLAAGQLELTGVLRRVGAGRAQQGGRMRQVVQDRGRHDESGGPPRIGVAHQGFPPPSPPPDSSEVPGLPLLRSRSRLARSSTGVGVGLALGVLEEVVTRPRLDAATRARARVAAGLRGGARASDRCWAARRHSNSGRCSAARRGSGHCWA